MGNHMMEAIITTSAIMISSIREALRYSYGGWNNCYPYTYPNYYYSYPMYYPPYTYPNYYYTTPEVYSIYYYNQAYNYYDPWWATNAYGWTGATYHYFQ
jgi:hypothetical protein